jgi:hypothetical protein
VQQLSDEGLHLGRAERGEVDADQNRVVEHRQDARQRDQPGRQCLVVIRQARTQPRHLDLVIGRVGASPHHLIEPVRAGAVAHGGIRRDGDRPRIARRDLHAVGGEPAQHEAGVGDGDQLQILRDRYPSGRGGARGGDRFLSEQRAEHGRRAGRGAQLQHLPAGGPATGGHDLGS